MPVQAYIDDSCDAGRVLVLAGYLAGIEQWEAFSSEWQDNLDRSRISRFKMVEVGNSPSADRLLRAGLFYRTIERYLNVSFAIALDLAAFARAVEETGMRVLDNPYDILYRGLMQLTAQHKDVLNIEGNIDFIFDNHGTASSVVRGFDEFKEYHSNIVPDLGRPPRFEDDLEFLPLQAADLFAWHVRRQFLVDGTLMKRSPVMSWSEIKKLKYFVFEMGYEEALTTLMGAKDILDRTPKVSFSIDLSWPKTGGDA